MIRVYEEEQELYEQAAQRFAQLAAAAVAARGRFTVALSGGQTPRRLYECLARTPFCDRVDWGKVYVFWGDERCVPPEHENSNQRMVRAALLQHVPVREDQVYPVTTAAAPAEAAAVYEKTLRRVLGPALPAFDLILLGLGEDGHTASLFPETAALKATDEWVVAAQRPLDGSWRVSFTLPLINQAAHIMFLVTGAAKAAIVQRIVQAGDKSFPAGLVSPGTGKTEWLLDQKAAQFL